VPRRCPGFTMVELMIVMAIIALLVAIAIPGLLAAQRSSNERSASASLKTIVTAQTDFNCSDRDNNRIRDYWTADVYGLYGLYPLDSAGTVPPDGTTIGDAIRLIEPSLATADGQEDATGASYGNVSPPASIILFAPKAGFVYRAFASMETSVGAPTTLLNDTDTGGLGPVHDTNRYAVMAAPENLGTGRVLFMVSTDGIIYKYTLPAGYSSGYTGGTTSTTTITGTGQAAFNAASVFPAAPSSLGCAKLD